MPSHAPRLFGPNWFTPVMGTGIIATAASTLPVQPGWLLPAARGVWVLAAVLLAVIAVTTVVHHVWWPGAMRHYLDDPVLVHAYGAVPMALLTVGGGAVSVGAPLLGTVAAVALAAVLLTVGTVLGVVTAIGVPRLVRARGGYDQDADATWLLPVVPPLVSAAVVPLLSPYLPPGWPRLLLLGACAALLLVGVLSAAAMLVPILLRLRRLGRAPASELPPSWIFLGLLGQSVTAVHTIGDGAVTELGDGWALLGPAFGLPVIGAALVLLVALTFLTVRACLRPDGLPFALTWWSFIFPTGTVVTGASALAVSTGLLLSAEVAAGLYVALVVVWLLVAARTLRGLADRSLLPRVD